MNLIAEVSINMKSKVRYVNYLVGVLCLASVLFIMKPVFSSCCIAGIIAYLLNPLVNRLESLGLQRMASSFIIISASALALMALAVFLAPIAYSQITKMVGFLVSRLPAINVNGISSVLNHDLPGYNSATGTIDPANLLRDWLNNKNVGSFELLNVLYINLSKIVIGIVNSGAGVGSMVFKTFVTMLLSLYILGNWPTIIKHIQGLIPSRYYESFSLYTTRIDNIISAYIRGQTGVCLVLSAYYCVCFLIIGLEYSLILGFLSGIMTFIPYLGPMLCSALGIGLAALQGFDFGGIVSVALMFVAGQLMESNVVTPLIIGKKLDLSPGWIVIGMVVFSAHAGFVGALLSVPITAIAGVLIQLATEQYMRSNFYLGK